MKPGICQVVLSDCFFERTVSDAHKKPKSSSPSHFDKVSRACTEMDLAPVRRREDGTQKKLIEWIGGI